MLHAAQAHHVSHPELCAAGAEFRLATPSWPSAGTRRWANLRAVPKTLIEIKAHQIAATVHDRRLQQHQNNPSQQTAWRTDLADRLFAPPEAVSMNHLRSGKFPTT